MGESAGNATGKAYLLLDKNRPDILPTIQSFRDQIGVPGDASFQYRPKASDFDLKLGEFAESKGFGQYSAIEITAPKLTNWGAAQEGKIVANQLYNSPRYFPGELFYGAIAYGNPGGNGYSLVRGRELPYSRKDR